MMTAQDRWRWLLFPAVTMSLGWGLRGFIGGGPLGAMIPGALVALALCRLLGRDGGDAAVVAALGAVGVGFGGQMTYGQTIGLAFQPATMAWGLTGLALKGAIWGLLGGAVLGLALTRDRHTRRGVLIAFALMAACTYAGWKLINEPKLVYFSNRFDRPRPELWAGLLLGALALLVWARSRVAWRFALWAALGGGFGFGVGGWIQVAGRAQFPAPWLDWWKVMELFFGFCFGAALGGAAWRSRGELSLSSDSSAPAPAWHGRAAVLVVPAGLFLLEAIHSRLTYTLVGAGLMALALFSPSVAWQVAVTMTYCAFSIDYIKSQPQLDPALLWIGVVATTLVIAWLAARWQRVLPLWLLLLWTANFNSYAKSFTARGIHLDGALVMESVFTLLGLAATWMALAAGITAFPDPRSSPRCDVPGQPRR